MSSSRIFRPADFPDAATLVPIIWRRAGEATQPQDRRATDARRSDSAPAAEHSVEQERQIEARIATAREQGRAEAENAAQQRALERLSPVLAALQAVLGELSGQGRRLRVEAEGDTVKLAVTIAKRILHRELAVDPEAILGLVKAAFAKVEARETHRLRVAPADAELVRRHREALDLQAGIEIVADGALSPGSAVFETSRGELDASIDTQLAEIDRGLTDVVRKRLR